MAPVMRVSVTRKLLPAAGAAPERTLFERLELSIPAGETCAMIGPSGVGKSTLLDIVAGLDRAFEGTVSGRPEPIGFAFQSPRLLPWLDARGNLDVALPRPAGGRAARGSKVERWLADVGLSDAAGLFANRLSAGMAQRLSFARALAVRPSLLLLDEPFSALDEATASLMRNLLAEVIRRDRPTTLIVTHDLDEILHLADRVVVLGGRPAAVLQDVELAGRDRGETMGLLRMFEASRPKGAP
jgi:ABC-type nitrate/sulfonate/bicarbonate transport system ATPase subunit